MYTVPFADSADGDAVRAWLTLQKRGALTPAFLEDGYDTLEAISSMTWDDDLSAIEGMKRGFRAPLVSSVAALKDAAVDPASEC